MRCAACDRAMPSGARFCPSCGVPVDRAGAAAPAEERKIVTVVFCDLVGSTALSGVLDPETLRTVVLRYFDRMRAPLEACGGTVEKFIGDAVMAVFGVPVTHEDDARRALSAALAMLDAIRDLNENELHPTLGIRLAVRIGVNTGPAVTSTDVSTRQALVSGETVNVAARLEQNAAEGEVLIGPETRRAAGPTARSEPVGPLRLKGKTAPVTAYRLLAVAEDDPRLSRRFDVPLVGRTAELGVLRQALRDVTGRHDAPNVLVVHGEAGMGKTRLVHEWLRGTGPACAQGSGRCRPYGEHGSLAPLADAVRELLRRFPDLPDPVGADGDTDERDEIKQALALLAGGLLEDGTPNPSVDDTCAATGYLLAALARRRPVVLVVDDCQWASDVLLDVLGTLAGDLTASPVLFVCLARPDLLDRRSDWASTGRATRSLPLPGLTTHEAATVAETLMEVGAHGSGEAVAEDTAAGSGVPAHVLEAAGGNPLHLEHLVAAVMEHGSGYRAQGSDELPTTLQALLGARIGALGRAERTTLDLAAVVGREFTADDVAALAERDHDGVPADVLADASAGGDAVPSLRGGVEGALVRLRGHRLVDAPDAPDGSGRGTPVLRFSSGLLHEVTYHSMAKRARAERHEHLAAQLAARSPDAAVRDEDRTEDRTVEASAGMAGHLEHAYRYRTELGIAGPRTEALRRAAAHRLVESGTRALARSDLAWADGLLRRALELTRDGEPERITATRGLGEVCLATGRTDEGCSLLRDVLTAPAGTDPPEPAGEGGVAPHTVETAHARLALSVVSADLAGGTPGEVAQRTMDVFERAGDELGQARAAVRLAQERQFEGRHEAADLLLSRGLEHARRSGAEPERALALGAMGISLWRGPEPVPGATDRARRLLAEHGAQRPTVRLTLNCPLAVLFALGERWQDAHACLTRVRRLVDGLGYAEGAVVLPLFHATVESLAGDERHALELLDEATAAAHALRAEGLLAALDRDSARLLLDAGRVDEAVARLAGATGPDGLDGLGGPCGPDGPGTASPAPAAPARSDAADLDGLLARIAVAEGRSADAVALSERAVRRAVGTDSPVVRAIAWLDRSEVVRRTGRAPEARAAAERAVACFEAKGHLPGVRRAAAARAAFDATSARTGGGSRPGTVPLPDRTPKGP